MGFLIQSLKELLVDFLYFISKIKYFSNQKSIFQLYEEKEKLLCYEHFYKEFKTSVFLEDRKQTRIYSIEKAIKNDENKEMYYLEFGVFKGTSLNLFSKYVNKVYGFDSFEGLREDWAGYLWPEGHFDLKKKVPRLRKNAIPLVGWVQDTLPEFLKEHSPQINFVHMDLDTYESSKFVLEKIKPYLIDKSIILFDELYNFPGWDVGEYKALTEVFDSEEYKFIAFSKKDKQVAIQIIQN